MWSNEGCSTFQEMQGKTRSHKPALELGLGKITRRKMLANISEVVKEGEVRIESCSNVETTVSPLLRNLEVETQLEEEATPSKLIGETLLEIEVGRGGTPIEIDSEVGVDTLVTMAQDGERGGPPSIPPIDLLVRPRGLPTSP